MKESSESIFKIFDCVSSLLRLKAVTVTKSELTEHLRQSVCDFQLDFTNYQFLASKNHQEFKEAFERNSSDCQIKYNKLIQFLESGFKKLCGKQAQNIQNYFTLSHIAREIPRVGIHAVCDNNDVHDIIMIPSVKNNPPKKIDNYSVFLDIQDTGLPYLDNNIPKTVKTRRDYLHAGLNLEVIRNQYRRRIRDCKVLSRWRNNFLVSRTNDNNWKKMGAKHGGSLMTLYKSHMVIPITFKGHADRQRLNQSLVDILKLDGEGRSILGFVFVDHSGTYYFDDQSPQSFQNIDVNVMYIFADMISLLMITMLTYTTGSKTFEKYLKLYGEQ